MKFASIFEKLTCNISIIGLPNATDLLLKITLS